MVVHTFHSNTLEAKTDGSMGVLRPIWSRRSAPRTDRQAGRQVGRQAERRMEYNSTWRDAFSLYYYIPTSLGFTGLFSF